jgi:hypothetical protein
MSRLPLPLLSLIAAAALAATACDRPGSPATTPGNGPGSDARSPTSQGTTATGADSARGSDSTVQAPLPAGGASTPMPVSPNGATNASTASKGNDLTNSTRASGNTNVYQPPSADNPAPSGLTTGSADPAASAPNQSTTSQTRGTSPMPNSGTLPGGTEGNTGSRRGGGKG